MNEETIITNEMLNKKLNAILDKLDQVSLKSYHINKKTDEILQHLTPPETPEDDS